eukprot:gnl/TRDRNA2_/TRDRNA2_106980_c1_seq1.p1 gnl/TRDRNA2_/TRDRNA2_106980_c1~~gnl/TRDRNA2_/TRDRNA2_106980_c1_seq1.p1  ORF type:complete len:182 (-),score=18.43 gnl/TRDRNA2_/TRDRNA2_106980_c1_seq1:16-516(-)
MSKDEFLQALKDLSGQRQNSRMIGQLGWDTADLPDVLDYIFDSLADGEDPFDKLLGFCPSKAATVKDIIGLRKLIRASSAVTSEPPQEPTSYNKLLASPTRSPPPEDLQHLQHPLLPHAPPPPPASMPPPPPDSRVRRNRWGRRRPPASKINEPERARVDLGAVLD